MKKSNRIEGDRLTARQQNQARAERGAASAPSAKEAALLRSIKEGRSVVVELPGEDQEAAECLDIMLRLYPGLTSQAVAQFLVDDALNQARREVGLIDTYGYHAKEAMAARRATMRPNTKPQKGARK